MKRSEVYRKAAQLVFDSLDVEQGYSRASCLAIADVAGDDWQWPQEALDYRALFAPDGVHEGTVWGEAWGDFRVMHCCRILALCFMAAIAEDEES